MTLMCSTLCVSEEDATDDQPAGWYFAACYYGCLPESGWFGPYASQAEAADAYKEMFADDYYEE